MTSKHPRADGLGKIPKEVRKELAKAKYTRPDGSAASPRDLAMLMKLLILDENKSLESEEHLAKKQKANDGEASPGDTSTSPNQGETDSNTANDIPIPSAELVPRLKVALRRGYDINTPGAGFDLIGSLSGNLLVAECIGKYLDPRSLVTLYSISRDFFGAINSSLSTCITTWVRAHNPASADIAAWANYVDLYIPDPAMRLAQDYEPEAEEGAIRPVRSLKWYQLVVNRGRIVREIVAYMARKGFRLPARMDQTLLKCWIVMEQPRRAQQTEVIRTLFRTRDLLNAQVFFVKLGFLCNDPHHGPGSIKLLDAFLERKSLVPLWQMLMGRKYRTTAEVLYLKVLLNPTPVAASGEQRQAGGRTFAIRPSTWPLTFLVAEELSRRTYDVTKHLVHFSLWGHIDPATGRNLTPSVEEIYVEDEEHANRSIDTSSDFKPFHCRRARWNKLTAEERQQVVDDEERAWRSLDNPHGPHNDYAYVGIVGGRRGGRLRGRDIDVSAWETSVIAVEERIAREAKYDVDIDIDRQDLVVSDVNAQVVATPGYQQQQQNQQSQQVLENSEDQHLSLSQSQSQNQNQNHQQLVPYAPRPLLDLRLRNLNLNMKENQNQSHERQALNLQVLLWQLEDEHQYLQQQRQTIQAQTQQAEMQLVQTRQQQHAFQAQVRQQNQNRGQQVPAGSGRYQFPPVQDDYSRPHPHDPSRPFFSALVPDPVEQIDYFEDLFMWRGRVEGEFPVPK